MKLATPRLDPIQPEDWSDEIKKIFWTKPIQPEDWSDEIKKILQPNVDKGTVFNIFKTLSHHPDLFRRWLVFGNHVLFKSTLPPRERELIILRIG